MPTLNEILDNDLGLGTEKTANVKKSTTDIEKLAMEIGLIDTNDETQFSSQDNIGTTKEAHMSLDTIYEGLFPEDDDIFGGQGKFAADESEEDEEEEEDSEEEKTASIRQELIGERAYGYYEHFVNAHIEKIAAEVAGKIMDDEDESEDAMETDGDDGEEGEKAMGMHQSSGIEVSKHSPEGEVKQAAVRKHLLKLMIGE